MRIGKRTRLLLASGAALAVIGGGTAELVYASHIGPEVEVVDHARCRGTDELGNWKLVPAGTREKLGNTVSVCIHGMWVDETPAE